MRKVTIVPYVKKAGVPDITYRLIEWLKDHDVEFELPIDDASALGIQENGVREEKLFDGVDLVVSLGGDGTTLRAVRLLGKTSVPIVGVNLGEMGFLMWIMPDQLEEAMEKILSGYFRVDERMMLKAQVNSDNGDKVDRLALNDIVIGREEFGRLVKLDVLVNGDLFCRYAADGLIVATPTGSTAYSFSAGGPIIAPATEVFVATPICPHSLNNRSLVFGASDTLTIKPVLVKQNTKVGVSVDGMAVPGLSEIDAVNITVADHRCKFVSQNGPGFYQALGEKLKKWLSLE